jgi:hypothetical protein
MHSPESKYVVALCRDLPFPNDPVLVSGCLDKSGAVSSFVLSYVSLLAH